MYKWIFIIAFSLLATEAIASDESQKLVKLLKFEQSLDHYKNQCKQTSKSISAEKLYQQNPDQFSGLHPNSELWPEVVKIYDEYYKSSCLAINIENNLDIIANQYDMKFSSAEMEELIGFLNSELGKKYIDVSLQASLKVNTEIGKQQMRHNEKAAEEFSSKFYNLTKLSKMSEKKSFWAWLFGE